MSAHINSRVDDDVYRSLSCEKRSGYRPVRARSGSRERIEHRSLERGRRADSSGPRAHIPRPSPSPTSTNAAQHIFFYLKCSRNLNAPSLPRVPSSTLWPHGLHPGQAAQTERGRTQKVSSRFFSPFPFSLFSEWTTFTPISVRQRRVRRDMLTSPIIPERGRSRSREAYPQLARAGSRGRSLSMERRGSRNSSESSLVDMEEMAKTLFRLDFTHKL